MGRSMKQRTDGMVGDYPENWKAISKRIKDNAGWKCERCGHPHDVENHYVLTVHHLDVSKDNCADWNLAALCQRCHLSVQGRVDFTQQYMLEHSEWMIPHVEGFKKAMGLFLEEAKGMMEDYRNERPQ